MLISPETLRKAGLGTTSPSAASSLRTDQAISLSGTTVHSAIVRCICQLTSSGPGQKIRNNNFKISGASCCTAAQVYPWKLRL